MGSDFRVIVETSWSGDSHKPEGCVDHQMARYMSGLLA